MESIRNMVGLWQDSKMMSIIPLIMYSGLEVSFIWNDFTNCGGAHVLDDAACEIEGLWIFSFAFVLRK